ncbi:long-chain-fatty-acid--CoA ligase [Allosaccharopolyspora coralli]|uniref:Long-chain-fatty-acid--CoA ligase n=1 Tax=Allosaccharopolyspora coralli TaxID=2665642 RepID=A0A5Q3Q9V8_9PSEU|nr:long-chain fatty acid--CoA ligase [Allosaccharopolyspora coralli]QGK70146.1 long-chain-fatty-acid--CoA ligase [Allosaccharopolyspora coralli]
MRNEGVGSWPYRRARSVPDAIAVTFRGENLSYARLDERVTRLAHALRELGVDQGDRVALLSRNHPSYLETLFAAGLLGAVFVPLNARLTAPEVAYCLQDSGTSVFIHSAELTDVGIAAAEQAGCGRRVVVDGDPDVDSVGYEDIVATADTRRVDLPVTHDDACFIMYTSGTTGRPKGVVLTHRNIVFSAMNAVIDLDLLSDEVSLVCAPLFHTAALDFVALPTLLKGGTVRIEEGFDAERVLDAIEESGVTYMFGAPTMCDALSAHPDWASTDLSSIRRMIVAAAPVPPRTLHTFAERGVKLCQAYGLTETGPGALILTPDKLQDKLGTAGVPHFFTDVSLADAEGEPVAAGERGEIRISGPNVMREYWNQPDATTDSFADDWFRSGDLGVADDDGFVTVVDRMKDMIISGGENIYPAEVEATLLELAGVAECAVFGVPDERWGEVGRAAVTVEDGTRLSEQDMREFLLPRLAKFKIPASFVVVDAIPRNASGKIRKDQLREREAG